MTEKLDTDKEKALAIYDYIINTHKYDHDKITELEADYIPSVDKIIYSGDGICFDYAALYAAMLRSINIPAKLVKGYKNDIDSYHAWNEVYIKELGWIIVDTTYDSAMLEDKISFKFIKDVSKYKKKEGILKSIPPLTINPFSYFYSCQGIFGVKISTNFFSQIIR